MNLKTTCNIIETENNIKIEILNFPTHVLIRNETKYKHAEYMKINTQRIYSGLHFTKRNKIVGTLKDELVRLLKPYFKNKKNLNHLIPLKVSLEWHVPPNWESIKYSKKTKTFSAPPVDKLNYKSKFDADNQWFWIKIFTDVISQKLKLIPEDNVSIIPQNGGISFHPVDDIDKRKLVFIIEKINDPRYLNKLGTYFNY